MKNLDIKAFSDQLMETLKGELEVIAKGSPEVAVLASKSVVATRSALVRLKEFVRKYTFKDGKEEIEFFKTIKPVFASQHHYYNEVFDLSLNEPIVESTGKRAFHLSALNRLTEYTIVNREFYHYCLSNSSHLDDTYFRRKPNEIKNVDIDTLFTTEYDGVLSTFLANQLLKEYLIRKLSDETSQTLAPSLTWTGTKAALIELIYALQSADVINKGKSHIREIATGFEKLFQINLGNYSRQFQDIRIRKTGKTNFIDELKHSLEQRMDESDA
jgi:hypothetical protein